MEIDLDELERLALEATGGPWIGAGPSFGDPLPRFVDEVIVDAPGDDDCSVLVAQAPGGERESSSADMLFIAAANPVVVLELVRQLRELRVDADRWQKVRWLMSSKDVSIIASRAIEDDEGSGADYVDSAVDALPRLCLHS